MLENGRVKIRSRNRVARFRCRRRFVMMGGDRVATCSNGVWRGAIPKCIGEYMLSENMLQYEYNTTVILVAPIVLEVLIIYQLQHSKTKANWHLWEGHKKWVFVKSLICTNIKYYRKYSIHLLTRLYAILLSITKKTARKWKFGIVDDASCSAHKCQLALVLL